MTSMPVYNALSTQKELERLLELRAHNLSNAGTEGFLSRNAHISGGSKFGSGVHYARNSGFFTNMAQGPLRHTGDRLDVAFDGKTFLAVGTQTGEALTKSGKLIITKEGELQTASGFPVLEEGGGRIIIPPETATINISNDGFISTENGQVGRLRLVQVKNPAQNLSHASGNLFTVKKENLITDENMRVQQYFVNGSNVNPILEVTAILKIQKQYQQTMGMVENIVKISNDGTENLLSTLPV